MVVYEEQEIAVFPQALAQPGLISNVDLLRCLD